MAIVDDQARHLFPAVLRLAAERVEKQETLPFERHPGSLVFLHHGISLIDRATDQTFYGLVYVMISESEEEIDQRAALLQPPPFQ